MERINSKDFDERVFSFDFVKSRIHERLLSMQYRDISEYCREFLIGSIYRTWYVDVSDLAVDAFTAVITVTKNILDLWGVSLEAVKNAAKENDAGTSLILSMDNVVLEGHAYEYAQPFTEEELDEIMCLSEPEEEMLNEIIDSYDFDESEPMPCDGASMVAITNRKKQFGAIAALDRNVQKRLAEIFPDGYLLIPSSIHEMLAIPWDPSVPIGQICDIIREINDACEVVRPEERLSNMPLAVVEGELLPISE